MSTSKHLFASALALAALAAHAGGEHVAKHGGVMVGGKAADYELVAKPDGLRLYVTDHGKPMDVSKASAKVTVMAGGSTQVYDLKPAGDKLESAVPVKLAPGAKAVAVVTNAGKTLGTAQFKLP